MGARPIPPLAGGGITEGPTLSPVSLALHEPFVTVQPVDATEPDHNAFPGVCETSTGLMVAYRKANEHAVDSTSVLVARWSDDDGATWTGETVIYDPPDGWDIRSAVLTRLSTGRIIRSGWIRRQTEFQAQVAYSGDDGATWSAAIECSVPTFDYLNQVESPVLELPSGRLLLAISGEATGDSWRSVGIMASDDQGDTWSELSIPVDGEAFEVLFQEPYLTVLDTGDIFCALRTDTEKIWYTVSWDGGASWSTAANTGVVSSGRPAVIQMDNGGLVIMARNNDAIYYRVSWDRGVTWSAATTIATGFQMVYAQMVEVTPNVVAFVFGMEDPNLNSSYIGFSYLYADGATNPLGA